MEEQSCLEFDDERCSAATIVTVNATISSATPSATNSLNFTTGSDFIINRDLSYHNSITRYSKSTRPH